MAVWSDTTEPRWTGSAARRPQITTGSLPWCWRSSTVSPSKCEAPMEESHESDSEEAAPETDNSPGIGDGRGVAHGGSLASGLRRRSEQGTVPGGFRVLSQWRADGIVDAADGRR